MKAVATRFFVGLALIVLTGLVGRGISYPALAGGHKGDEATYILMAYSVVADHDLVYTRTDLDRFDAIYHRPGESGRHTPEGLFLKTRSQLQWSMAHPLSLTRSMRPESDGLSYGKAFAYAVAAAPFVGIGGLGGMFMFNVLLLASSLACAVLFARARVPGAKGTLIGVAFVMASSVPVWITWLTPEVFNFALVMHAFFLWLYKEVSEPGKRVEWLCGPWTNIVGPLLLGIATFSKPTNALLVVPMGSYALSRLDLRRAILLSLAFFAGSAGLYGANAIQSGEWNYQGAVAPVGRVTFYGHFPFEAPGVDFRTAGGSEMVTNDSGAEDLLAPAVMWPLLRHNFVYFWAGRHSGLIPYFFPGVAILFAWLIRWRQATRWQWFSFAAIAGSVLVLLLLTPNTWNGGGGPPGNRYFLSLYPPLLFLLPAASGWVLGISAAVVGVAFSSALTLHPFVASQSPWLAPAQAPRRWLPVELTLMNDLPARLNPDRGHILFRRDAPAVYIYFMDEQAYHAEGQGFWIAPGLPADVVFRVDTPVRQISLTVHSDIDNEFRASAGGGWKTVSLKAGERKTLTFDLGPGVHAENADVHQISVAAEKGFRPSDRDKSSRDTRMLGVFVDVDWVLR